MIRDLDNLLRQLFVDEVPEILNDSQVSFRPPDDDWRSEVLNLQQLALNVYLVDLRENRLLRSNAQVRAGVVDGQVTYTHSPVRVDCHYLITAWSPAQPGPAVEPTPDEHHLLYQAMAALTRNGALNPVVVYGEGAPILAGLPPLFLSDLPIQVLPVEGFIKQPEFWGTMGDDHRWRPAIYLIVTLPLEVVLPPAGPPVTTPIAEFGRSDRLGEVDVLHTIGGQVLDATGLTPQPLPGAWVRLSTAAGAVVTDLETGANGRFIFQGLIPGDYQLEWRAQGFPDPAPRPITVPSSTGEYDLQFV